MPRLSRNSLQTSYFHVMVQGINKSFIFNNSIDIKYYIKKMYEISELKDIKIISYCIMNNHSHILLQVNSTPDLSNFMQRLNTTYGKYYNSKYNRVGYVFRNRYQSQGIFSEKHLYNCMHYIYNNPVKAGICQFPWDYPYSNYKKIPNISNENEYLFIDIENKNDSDYQSIIKNFLSINHLDFNSLKKNIPLLKKLIIILKTQNLSLRKIADLLHIGREKIRLLSIEIDHQKAVNKERPL